MKPNTRRSRLADQDSARRVYRMVSHRTRADLIFYLKLGVLLLSFAALLSLVVWGIIFFILFWVA